MYKNKLKLINTIMFVIFALHINSYYHEIHSETKNNSNLKEINYKTDICSCAKNNDIVSYESDKPFEWITDSKGNVIGAKTYDENYNGEINNFCINSRPLEITNKNVSNGILNTKLFGDILIIHQSGEICDVKAYGTDDQIKKIGKWLKSKK